MSTRKKNDVAKLDENLSPSGACKITRRPSLKVRFPTLMPNGTYDFFKQKKETKNIKNCDENVLLKRPAPLNSLTMSPIKHCGGNFVIDGSPSTSSRAQLLLLKSPSPRKPVQRSIACRNVGILLQTPEKNVTPTCDELEEAVMEGTDEIFPPVASKKKRKPSTRKSSSTGVGDNFVRINLRRKIFAPKHQTNFKKKWSKKKRFGGKK